MQREQKANYTNEYSLPRTGFVLVLCPFSMSEPFNRFSKGNLGYTTQLNSSKGAPWVEIVPVSVLTQVLVYYPITHVRTVNVHCLVWPSTCITNAEG